MKISHLLPLFILRLAGLTRAMPVCPEKCKCVPSEHFVDCTHKSLTQVPRNIPNTTETLFLAYNNITRIQKFSFRGLKYLQRLTLNHNSLSFIGMGTFDDFSPKKFSTLTLNHNNLTSIGKMMFRSLIGLESLDLSYNQLVSIHPDELGNLFGLKQLSLSGNKLTSLDLLTFQYTTSVQKLNLSGNNIASYHPRTFNFLPQLLDLDMSGNRLTSVHPNTFRWTNCMTNLKLNGNNLTRVVGNQTAGLYALMVLDLSNNRITHVESDGFIDLIVLRSLDMHNNQLSHLGPAMFEHLTGILGLVLAKNRITSIHPCALSHGMSSLRHIDLSFNRLTSFHELTFKHVPSLIRLDAHHNNLSVLRTHIFPSVDELTLHGNRYPCSCRFLDTLRHLQVQWLQIDCLRDFKRDDRRSRGSIVNVFGLQVPQWSEMTEWLCADDCKVRRYIREADCIICSEQTSHATCVDKVPPGKACQIINIKNRWSLDGAKEGERGKLCMKSNRTCPSPIPCSDKETHHSWYSNLTTPEVDNCDKNESRPLQSDEAVNWGTILAIVVLVLLVAGFYVVVQVCVRVGACGGTSRDQSSSEE